MADATRNVLITGAFGYVGRRLVAAIARAGGFRVRMLTRRPEPVAGWADCQAVCFRNSWQEEGSALLDRIQHVVHLGGPDEKECAADPDRMAFEAGRFTRGLMEAAARHGVESLVMASTIHVYGAALHDEVTEAILPQPTHPYGVIKRYCEDIVTAGSLTGGPRSIVLRLANGFGAPLSRDITRWSLLVNDLCRQAVEKRRVEVRSDPRTLRNFITIEDICDAISHCITHEVSTVPATCFHVGSSRASSIGEMALLVQNRCTQVLGFEPELILPQPGREDIPPLHYNISRFARVGFSPREDFATEVDNTLRACREWFGNASVNRMAVS